MKWDIQKDDIVGSFKGCQAIVKKSKTWYELHIDLGNETITIQSFDTLKEARAKRKLLASEKTVYVGGMIVDFDTEKILHIDKWRNPENPQLIKSII